MSGRIRTIKPELLEDAKTAGLSHIEFRLFVSAILMADDYGNLRATPHLICGTAFWATNDTPTDVEAAMTTLEEEGLLRTYEMRGQLYAHVCGWNKHQRVDKPGKPRVPAENEPEARPAKPWVTYIVRLGDSGPVKIGKTTNVTARIAKLQTGCPEKLHVLRVVGKNIETELHRRYAEQRRHGEWFELAPELVETLTKEQFASDSRTIPIAVATDSCLTSDHRSPITDPDRQHAPEAPADTSKGPKVKRGSRLTDAWQPSEGSRLRATELLFTQVELESTLLDFKNYWISLPGQRATKLDWDRTFQNRLAEVAARRRPSGKVPTVQQGPKPGEFDWRKETA